MSQYVLAVSSVGAGALFFETSVVVCMSIVLIPSRSQ